MSSPRTTLPATADAVVIGGGTVGAWAAWFLRQAGLGDVVLVERDTLGQGASSRAAGMVRAQGGTPLAVALGLFSIAFYNQQRERIGIDSGFVAQGYFMPAFDEAEVQAGRDRVAMQQALGVDVRWLGPDQAEAMNPTMAPGVTLGGSYAPGDGYLKAPRNMLAAAAACARAGVHIVEGVSVTGMAAPGGRVSTVHTTAGSISTPRVIITGGPTLAEVAGRCGVRVPVGGTRHQVIVTEPHHLFDPMPGPMVFDVGSGIYWRPEDGGLLFGMSNPEEPPGENRQVDWEYARAMIDRLAHLVPSTRGLGIQRAWAATIDYTSDRQPIIGPALGPDGPIDGVTIACAAGHGMMWGPGVACAAADLAVSGHTEVVDVASLGLDRFDVYGNSNLTDDPIALPFPHITSDLQPDPIAPTQQRNSA